MAAISLRIETAALAREIEAVEQELSSIMPLLSEQARAVVCGRLLADVSRPVSGTTVTPGPSEVVLRLAPSARLVQMRRALTAFREAFLEGS